MSETDLGKGSCM